MARLVIRRRGCVALVQVFCLTRLFCSRSHLHSVWACYCGRSCGSCGRGRCLYVGFSHRSAHTRIGASLLSTPVISNVYEETIFPNRHRDIEGFGQYRLGLTVVVFPVLGSVRVSRLMVGSDEELAHGFMVGMGLLERLDSPSVLKDVLGSLVP